MENNVNGGMNEMDNSTAMPKNPMASKMNAGNNLPPVEPAVPNVPVMTAKKKSPIATICLAILAVLGIGFGVYMYFFPMNCGTKGNNLADEAECKCEKCEECPKCEKCEAVECETAEDAYKKYADSLLNDNNPVIVTSMELPKPSGDSLLASAVIGQNNILGVSFGTETNVDIDSDVLDVFFVKIGQAVDVHFIYTKADGSVYDVKLIDPSTGEYKVMEPKKLDGVSRIVEVFQSFIITGETGGGANVMAVDIDGKITELNLK